MRFFLVVCLFFTLMLPCFSLETTVASLYLNKTNAYDIELLLNDKNDIFIPFKSFSEIYGIDYKINHSNHNISFTFEDKQGVVSSDYIKFDNQIISKNKNYYLKKGLMDETKDEIFCSSSDLEQIFSSKILVDSNDLSIFVETKEVPFILKNESSDKNNFISQNSVRTYKNVVVPDNKSKISFDNISFRNNTMSDVISQYMLEESKSNFFFNNNSQIEVLGKLYDGELKLDLNTYNYLDEPFTFGGVGVQYKNKYKNYVYELGKISGIIENNYSIANQVLGFQVKNYDLKKENYKDLNGYVESDSLVKVFLNDKEVKTLSTYDGYYSLADVTSDKDVKKVKLVELKQDNTEKIILEKDIVDPKILKQGEKRYDFLAGVSGFNNRLFSQNNYVYKLNTKKLVLGSEYTYGIKDNININSKLFLDNIVSTNNDSLFQNVYFTDSLLTSGTFKNPNNLDGITLFNTLNIKQNENLTYKLTSAISNSRDLSLNKNNLLGINFSSGTVFKQDNFSLETELFCISPNFYLAGSNGNFVSDRLGSSLSFSTTNNGFNTNLNYKKYFSNLDKKFDGGLLNFDDYSFSLNKNSDKFFNLKFNINGRNGSNSFAENKSYFYNLNLSKRLNNKTFFELGEQVSNYKSDYKLHSEDNFNSDFSTIYANLNYKLPKNLGEIKLGHEIINYGYSGSENKYNMFKVGYSFPEIKNVTLSVGTGYKYTGNDNGFDISANLGIRTKQGRTININYQYNRQGGFIVNNMYMPMNNRHSLNIVLNDVFALLPNHIKSVGYLNKKYGYAEIVSYIDKNKNGKYDKGDIGVKNVPVKCNWVDGAIYTNRKGKVYPDGIEKGVYNVSLDLDKLPATLELEKKNENKKIVRIEPNKTTKIEFPVKSCVGNISGKLNIKDDFGRKFNIEDFIVVLLDEQGKEHSYSTVDLDGNYYLSGIEPGNYVVQLDQNLIDEYSLFSNKNAVKVNIPYIYDKFVELKNIDLFYNSLM